MGGVGSCRCKKEKQIDDEVQFDKEMEFREEIIEEDDEEEYEEEEEEEVIGVKFDGALEKVKNCEVETDPGHKKNLSTDIKMEIFEDNIILPEVNPLNSAGSNSSNGIYRNKKRIGSLTNNNPTNGSGKPPLEIINEMNAEGDNKSKEIELREGSGILEEHDYNKMHTFNNKNGYDHTNSNDNSNKISPLNTESNLINMNVNANVIPTQSKEYRTNNTNTSTTNNNGKNTSSTKTPNKSSGMRVKSNITSIIPEFKILNCSDNEILFHSELKKLINQEIKSYSSQLYSARFCSITKKEFIYYKSKEQFITMQKPLCSIPLSQISKVSLIKYNPKAKNYDHFFISVNNSYDIDQNSPTRVNMDTDNDNVNSKRVLLEGGVSSFLPPQISSSFSKAKRSSFLLNPENNEPLLVFTSDKEDLLNKWVVVINYFINK
jgi:hypothetical protein